jgi:hypothetical protein
LPAVRENLLRAHLADCESCRAEYARVQLAIASAQGEEQGTTPGRVELLSKIQASIQQWQAGVPDAAGAAEGLKQAVMEHLVPYLGDRGARQVMQGISPDGHDMLSAIEPVLANFLGYRAAAQLVNVIVETKLVRNYPSALGSGKDEVSGPLSKHRDSV